MKNTSRNCSAKEFSECLHDISSVTPKADAYGDRDSLSKDYPGNNQHEVQKKHIISWFSGKNEISAKTVYNRLRDPAMMIWIAESFQVNSDIIECAIMKTGNKYKCDEFGKKNGKKGSSLTFLQSKIIRSILTWSVIWDSIEA